MFNSLFILFQYSSYIHVSSRAHPYLFGLAVAGGLMTFGIEGVVVGPVLLCAFVIFVELSRSILKPTTTELPPADSTPQ